MRTLVRSVVAVGLPLGASALLFFACATGDTGAPADGGPGTGTEPDSSVKDGASYGGDGSTAKDGSSDAGPTCVESDAGCSTGIGGSCGNGIVHCDGGAPVCEPVAATEACYTGGATTRSNGICHDGVQTCSDTTATCAGEVLPMAAENCFNNLDDDCDGFINNGCPKSLSLGGATPLASAGNGVGGGLHTVTCPSGAFVTRVDSWFDDGDQKASGVSIYCATPSLIQGATSYSVTLAANTPAPYLIEHGSSGPSVERTDDCGISGLTAIVRADGLADTHVWAQGYHCGTSAVTLAADNTITFNFVTDGNMTYNAYPSSGGTNYDRLCPASNVVVGFNVRDGAYMDNIAPLCAPLTVVYGAGTPDP